MRLVVIDDRNIMTDQGQVLEKREGTDEVKNLRLWKEERSHAERLEGK